MALQIAGIPFQSSSKSNQKWRAFKVFSILISYLYRQETCYARSYASVLEMGFDDFLLFRELMAQTNNRKDVSLLESLLKRNATLKKGF